jgi:hypothetical protein
MSRILTARMAAALTGGNPRIVLCKIEHPAGDFYCWSGVGSLVYQGHTWIGIGILGQITPIKSTSDLAIQDVAFSLSGVTPESLALIQGSVKGKLGTVWLGCLEHGERVVPDPYQILECELDVQDFAPQDDGSVMLTITGHSGFFTMERALNEVWSPENQKLLFPGDTGLDLLPSLQNQDIAWTIT